MFLAPNLTLTLKSASKKGAFREMVRAICLEFPEIDPDNLEKEIWDREVLLSTRIAPSIAIPHATLNFLQETIVCVGRSFNGIDNYDLQDEGKVLLIIMLVGSGELHLQTLGQIANRLANKKFLDKVLKCRRSQDLFVLFSKPAQELEEVLTKDERQMTLETFRHAVTLARAIKAKAILLHISSSSILPFFEYKGKQKLFIITQDLDFLPESVQQAKNIQPVIIPFKGITRNNQVEISLLFLISQGYIRKDDKVVSVLGLPESGILDTITVSDIEQEYKLFFALKGKGDALKLEQQVFARVIQIASELAEEGREGKSIGTLFVLGDHEQVMKYTQQMVVNPFKGYDEADCNILDPSLEETVKEFSRIDGAFIIRGDGVILAAGTYIRTDAQIINFPSGLGARHAAAATITAATDAVSVAISESTRKISIFKNGERVMML